MKRVLLAAFIALGVAAPSATADTYRDYKVTAQGHGTMTKTSTATVGETDEGEPIDALHNRTIGFDYNLDLREASVGPRDLPFPVNLRGDNHSWDASGEITLDGQLQVSNDPRGDATCRGSGGKVALTPDLWQDDVESREMTLFMVQRSYAGGSPGFVLPCAGTGYGMELPRLDIMNHKFALAPGFRNQDKVVVPWAGGQDCKEPEDLEVTHCRIEWNGNVTFEYVRSREVGTFDNGHSPGTQPPPETVQPSQTGESRAACVVPKVKGLAEKAAKRKLAAAGCKAKVKRVRHKKVKRGRVIKASAKPGSRLASGSLVTLTVSRGRR
jgi:hypothetical protein